MTIVNVKNITFKYPTQKNPILENVNLTVEKNDFVGITGSNGSGKSTLLKLILGIYTPQNGEIFLWGKNISVTKDRLSYLSQFEDIDFTFPITLYEVVQMGRLHAKFINNFSTKDHKKIKEVMEKMNIWKLRDKSLGEVSGGQKQRTFLARALASEPELLILDEPLTNLDIHSQTDFYDLLKDLNENITIIVVDHNIEILSKYANKIACIDHCKQKTLKTHIDDLNKLSKI
ncbi:MAG: ABC transporter [Candidatus Moraniibacteriota bacterium]|nr:MAG: ABC transporter [Candidatus Moranbacteria bacterium]